MISSTSFLTDTIGIVSPAAHLNDNYGNSMRRTKRNLGTLLALAALLQVAGHANAARVRYHFTPVDANGATTLRPGDVSGYGRRLTIPGFERPMPGPPPGMTFLMTYWHPLSSRRITVPVTFPDGTPTIQHGRDWIMYDYGSYSVRIRFLADGSVDVIYDNGLLRAW